MPHLPLVKRGSTGSSVTYCQQRLNAKGFPVTVDGVFGPQTESMVRRFQASEHITVDGVVGSDTWNRLCSEGEAKPPTDLLEDKKSELIAQIPADASPIVRKMLVVGISYLGEREEPNGANDGPGIHDLVKHFNPYWWRLKKGPDGETDPQILATVKKRGYALDSECIVPQAWCAMAQMNFIREALDLPYWDWEGGFRIALDGHPFRYFFGNGGQVEDWAKNRGSWVKRPDSSVYVPAGAIATVGGDKAGSDTKDAEHVLGIIRDLGTPQQPGTHVLTIEGNVSNAVGSYKRHKSELRGHTPWEDALTA